MALQPPLCTHCFYTHDRIIEQFQVLVLKAALCPHRFFAPRIAVGMVWTSEESCLSTYRTCRWLLFISFDLGQSVSRQECFSLSVNKRLLLQLSHPFRLSQTQAAAACVFSFWRSSRAAKRASFTARQEQNKRRTRPYEPHSTNKS